MQMHQKPGPARNHALHIRSIERVIRVISDQLDVPLSNEAMADIACFSPCHFNRLFQKVTGIPPVRFHYALRIARAKELLLDTERGITDICFDVGYNSLGTFITRFNELVGVSPTAFRRMGRCIADMTLADLPLSQIASSAEPTARGIVGTIERQPSAGVIFTGLFRRALPEGRPSACALVRSGSHYVLPIPPDGLWFVMAVMVPETANGVQLLTLKGLARGRSAPIVVKGGQWHGDGGVTLAWPSPLDPPILAAIPIQIARLDSGNAFSLATARRDSGSGRRSGIAA
jgi:AraC-like DNA-binding protein